MSEDQENRAVILITIDALRRDHLESYGYQKNTAPNLEEFVRTGTTFLNARTNGPESPTAFSAIFTSVLPFLDGGYSPLPIQKITVPQILKENGISSFAIHSNPNLGRFFNYDRGFDIFLDGERYKAASRNNKSRRNIKNIVSSFVMKALNYKDLFNKLIYRVRGFNKLKAWLRQFPFITTLLLPFTPIAYNAPYITNQCISILAKKKKPLFLWAHYMDVHNPYNPPLRNLLNFRNKDIPLARKEYLNQKIFYSPHKFKITPDILDDLKLLYDGEINYIDEYLGKFLEFIKLKFQRNCLVIITADHGEGFFEHGFFGHQGTIFEELLHVPLFIVDMGKKSKVNKIDEIVQLLDIGPTILKYFGIPIPENYQGKSFLPIIKENYSNRNKYIFSECYQKNGIMKRNRKEGFIMLSIRKDYWKYIFDEEKDVEFLFNLKEDPKEQNNLINSYKSIVEGFRKLKIDHINHISVIDEKSKIVKSIKTLDLKF